MSQPKLQLKFIVFLLSFAAVYSKSPTQKFTKNFSSFPNNLKSNQDLTFLGNSSVNQNALQLTPDSGGSDLIVNKQNTSGRIFLTKKFKLWTGSSSKNKSSAVASFNSSFLINVYRQGDYAPGEGLTFLIAPSLEIPSQSYGEYLGLTNPSTDGDVNNKLIAIELDTTKQSYDPDANHVGLNLNSVKSSQTESLSLHGIEIAPDGTVFNNVWVNYDGVAKIIRVYIANQPAMDPPTPPMNGPTPPRPDSPVFQAKLDLSQYVAQDSYFGFSAATGSNNLELNCVLRWNFTVLYFPEDKAPVLAIALGVGIPVVLLLLVGVALLGWCLHKRRMRERGISSNIVGALRSLPGTPREFEFKDLKKATRNFDDSFKLGQGGYGVVYRAVLPAENLEVAVKWFSRESLKGEDDFLAELTIINRLRHKHLVRLLGWCHKNGKLLLLYEYMPNGSLDMHLFAGPEKPPLPWPLRYKILSGVASALHYLHNEYDARVVHRDVKASNIMLDSNFNARLGDFGLARALDNEKTSYMEADGVLGTVGYIAPECFHTGRATQRSDVYAFGAVLIEVVCGQRPGTKNGAFQFLVDWVWCLYREGRILDAVDRRLGEDYVAEEAEKVLLLGLACSHPIASERPKTQTIVQILSGNVPVPHVPPFKPAFVWPAMPEGDITETTSLTTTSLTSNLGSGWSPLYISRESYTDRSMV